jgi:hypothetical protein
MSDAERKKQKQDVVEEEEEEEVEEAAAAFLDPPRVKKEVEAERGKLQGKQRPSRRRTHSDWARGGEDQKSLTAAPLLYNHPYNPLTSKTRSWP